MCISLDNTDAPCSLPALVAKAGVGDLVNTSFRP
jgi:hypothetical protein